MDQQHVWGVRYIDELVCRDDDTPKRLYAAQDANFNVTSLVEGSPVFNAVQYFLYDPYGADAVYDSSWSPTVDAYNWATRFAGRQYDLETKFYCYRYRYYQVGIGGFTVRDPASFLAGLNLYEYVGNPIRFLDPSGLVRQSGCEPKPPTYHYGYTVTPSDFSDAAMKEWGKAQIRMCCAGNTGKTCCADLRKVWEVLGFSDPNNCASNTMANGIPWSTRTWQDIKQRVGTSTPWASNTSGA